MAHFGFDAFLSYTSEDRELARKLVDWLRKARFTIWFDEEQLVPGERFRAGLEQGLRGSRHLIALLTPSYANRNWTVRELDLFDLKADRTRRRMLGIQIGEVKRGSLDQAFQVNQRLFWKSERFDPEAFWLLYCGLKDVKPGPRAEWAGNGNKLVATPADQSATIASSQPTTPTKARQKTRKETQPADIQTDTPSTAPGYETEADQAFRERVRTKVRLAPTPFAAEWASLGPTNIGGRATCLVCHPIKSEVIWLGTAGGGVWKSDDSGKSWRHLWNTQETLQVGSLAIDLVQPDIIYCGTGEVNRLSSAGVGVYRSLNGGNTWSLFTSVRKHGLPNRIGVIAVDPFDSNHIRLGGANLMEGDTGGMHVSRDGGKTWKRENFLSPFSHSCHSIVFHPARKGVVFAALEEPGFGSGIWRSVDGGKNWVHLEQGLPTADSFRRTSLAIAPSKPDVIYAIAADSQGDGGVLGVFVSSDMGLHWKSIEGTNFKNEQRMIAANTIAVHPEKHDYVICGGDDLHLTRDGGKTWRQVTRWDHERGNPKYAHAGHHALIMPAAAPGRIYDANDGGMDFSDDGGKSWTNRSNGLAVTAYYNIDVAPSDSHYYGGSTEANGKVLTTTGRPDDHFELLGGGGGSLVFEANDSTHVYASYYDLNISRFRGRQHLNVSPPASSTERNGIWIAPLTIDRLSPKTVFTGTRRVWRTRTAGTSWAAVSPFLDGSNTSAIEISIADRNRIYVGTEKGGIFRSLDGGDSWSRNIAGALLPRNSVTSIKSGPLVAGVVLVSMAGFGRSHVFLSEDGGVSWTDVDQGRLPDVPHFAVVIPDDDPDAVYVCNEVGVFFSPDLGNKWHDLTGNLPNTPMMDLVYHQKEGALYVGTFGRGIWRAQIR